MPTDVLVELGSKIELFHTPAGTAFADVLIDGHRETWADPQQAAAGLAAAALLRGDWGGPAPAGAFAQRSICSRPAPNSMLPSGRSMSASPSTPAASISTSPMRAGVRSRSGRTAGT